MLCKCIKLIAVLAPWLKQRLWSSFQLNSSVFSPFCSELSLITGWYRKRMIDWPSSSSSPLTHSPPQLVEPLPYLKNSPPHCSTLFRTQHIWLAAHSSLALSSTLLPCCQRAALCCSPEPCAAPLHSQEVFVHCDWLRWLKWLETRFTFSEWLIQTRVSKRNQVAHHDTTVLWFGPVP